MTLNILKKTQTIKAKFFEVVNGFIKSSLSFSEELCLRGDSNEH